MNCSYTLGVFILCVLVPVEQMLKKYANQFGIYSICVRKYAVEI